MPGRNNPGNKRPPPKWAVISSNGLQGSAAHFWMNQQITTPATDGDVIQQIVNGDVNAFKHLLEKYQEHVLRIVKKHIPHEGIEEVAQDVFIRAFKSLPKLKNADRFKPWLSSISVRTCYDYWRNRYKSREVAFSSLSDSHHDWLERVSSGRSEALWEENVQKEEARQILDWALDRLSPEDRMVIELVYLEGLSGKEAAKLLGWSVANVKVRSFRARKKLRNMLSATRGQS
jgi:RNA polymerase sigma-70 factor, ECF subfamily